MEKRYKLLKDLPDVKAGSIAYYCSLQKRDYIMLNKHPNQKIPEIGWYWDCDFTKKCNYEADLNPDWFAPYLCTTDDNVDVFKGDFVYYIAPGSTIVEYLNIAFVNETDVRKHYMYFSTKEAAEEYLESLKPKFKVGDIVVTCNDIGKIIRIEKAKDRADKDYLGCLVEYGNYGSSFQDLRNIKFAKPDEIIKYYEQQGWVKGAKFKYAHTYDKILTIKDIFIRNNKVCLHHLETNIKELSNYDFSVLFIEDCELVKEPQYPKSWEDLNAIEGHWITSGSNIAYGKIESFLSDNFTDHKNVFSTQSQAKSALAFAQLTQLHAATIAEYNRVNNCDWKPNFNTGTAKWSVSRYENKLNIDGWYFIWHPLTFPTKELAQFALDNWKDLWEQYYELV